MDNSQSMNVIPNRSNTTENTIYKTCEPQEWDDWDPIRYNTHTHNICDNIKKYEFINYRVQIENDIDSDSMDAWTVEPVLETANVTNIYKTFKEVLHIASSLTEKKHRLIPPIMKTIYSICGEDSKFQQIKSAEDNTTGNKIERSQLPVISGDRDAMVNSFAELALENYK